MCYSSKYGSGNQTRFFENLYEDDFQCGKLILNPDGYSLFGSHPNLKLTEVNGNSLWRWSSLGDLIGNQEWKLECCSAQPSLFALIFFPFQKKMKRVT